MIDLKPFCEEFFEGMSVPFYRDGYTYATNGYMIVRIPGKHAEENARAPKVEAADYWQHNGVRGWAELPMFEPKYETCPCESQEVEACDECNSVGKYIVPECIPYSILPAAGFGLNTALLILMRELPGVEIENAPKVSIKGSPIMFRFDGGEGVLMPMRSKAYKED